MLKNTFFIFLWVPIAVAAQGVREGPICKDEAQSFVSESNKWKTLLLCLVEAAPKKKNSHPVESFVSPFINSDQEYYVFWPSDGQVSHYPKAVSQNKEKQQNHKAVSQNKEKQQRHTGDGVLIEGGEQKTNSKKNCNCCSKIVKSWPGVEPKNDVQHEWLFGRGAGGNSYGVEFLNTTPKDQVWAMRDVANALGSSTFFNGIAPTAKKTSNQFKKNFSQLIKDNNSSDGVQFQSWSWNAIDAPIQNGKIGNDLCKCSCLIGNPSPLRVWPAVSSPLFTKTEGYFELLYEGKGNQPRFRVFVSPAPRKTIGSK